MTGKIKVPEIHIGWTPADDARLIELYNQGLSYEKIAGLMPGRTKNACVSAGRRLDLPPRKLATGGKIRNAYSDSEKAFAQEAFEGGRPYAEIADAITVSRKEGKAVSRDAIIKLVKREKWARKAAAPNAGPKKLRGHDNPQARRQAQLTAKERAMETHIPTVEGITLVNAERSHCRFVCAPHPTEGAVLCGGKANFPKQPFCDRHAVKTYAPDQPPALRFGASFAR